MCRAHDALEGTVVRGAPASFDDHYSQAALFLPKSRPGIEQAHVVEAFTFELGKVYEEEIKNAHWPYWLMSIRTCAARWQPDSACDPPRALPPEHVDVSPALSQITDVPGPIDGRKVGVIADEKSDLAGIAKLRRALSNLGAELLVIAPSEERWGGAPTACLSTEPC